MKQAIGYVRISTKDQSNFSIDGQIQYITDFCAREEIILLETFKDEGFSAKNFDRPSWKELEDFIKKHHSRIDYLVVCKYDRFSRNAAEGLNMIERLEKKHKIYILSVFERLFVDHNSPYFFKQRADMLVSAEFELHVIRERTKFGLHQSAAAGRWIGTAPYGYKNARDEQNKPIILLDESKAPIVKFIYESFFINIGLDEIHRRAQKQGFARKGNSAIPRLLSNPVYAGLIKVPAFKDQPERLIKGIHEAIVPEYYYYESIRRLGNEKGPRLIINDDVPLRGVLKCHCGKELTAGRSKGKSKYYWYYKCMDHLAGNHNADKVHRTFDEVLKLMSIPDAHLRYLRASFEQQFEAAMKEKNRKLSDLNKQQEETRRKMESLEEKFLCDQITNDVYNRWQKKLQPEYSSILAEQARIKEGEGHYYDIFRKQLPRLGDMHHVYHTAKTPEKQELVRLVFKWSLAWVDNMLRTRYMMPLFAHNLQKMKEQRLLILDDSVVISMKNPMSARDGASLEPDKQIFILMQKIA